MVSEHETNTETIEFVIPPKVIGGAIVTIALSYIGYLFYTVWRDRKSDAEFKGLFSDLRERANKPVEVMVAVAPPIGDPE